MNSELIAHEAKRLKGGPLLWFSKDGAIDLERNEDRYPGFAAVAEILERNLLFRVPHPLSKAIAAEILYALRSGEGDKP